MEDPDIPDVNSGIYATDEFRMFHYKIDKCTAKEWHPWRQCPFAHRGDSLNRRHPESHSSISCQDFQNEGTCPRGDQCPNCHGFLERSLHPSFYRTNYCWRVPCDRKLCFYAHSDEELRIRPQLQDSFDPVLLQNSSQVNLHVSAAVASQPHTNATPMQLGLIPLWPASRVPFHFQTNEALYWPRHPGVPFQPAQPFSANNMSTAISLQQNIHVPPGMQMRGSRLMTGSRAPIHYSAPPQAMEFAQAQRIAYPGIILPPPATENRTAGNTIVSQAYNPGINFVTAPLPQRNPPSLASNSQPSEVGWVPPNFDWALYKQAFCHPHQREWLDDQSDQTSWLD